MAHQSDIAIERAFLLLDRWRHLPAYQLEPRAGVFFALFLPEVLGKHLSKNGRSIEIDDMLVPEFPIKKRGNNQSTKVDFLALSKSRELALLVELKTDMASKLSPEGKKQQSLLVNTAKDGIEVLVENSIEILKRHPIVRQTRQKYVHLLYCLEQLGLVSCEERLYKIAFEEDQHGIYDILRTVRSSPWVCSTKPKLEVLYVQPKRSDSDCTCVVDFDTFAGIVENGQGGQDIRRLFVRYLRTWASKRAGSTRPLDIPS